MLLEIKYLRIIIVLLCLASKQAIVAQEGSYEISVPRLQESVKIDGVLSSNSKLKKTLEELNVEAQDIDTIIGVVAPLSEQIVSKK